MTSNFLDAPLIVQFAAHTDKEFGDAAELIRSGGHMGGIDLNCGCPQKWAMQEGIGSALLKKPETIKSMVKAAKERAGNLPISIKIRIAHDLRETVSIEDFLKSLSFFFDVCGFFLLV
jgi:tRNA-dihydrouridine synthase 4